MGKKESSLMEKSLVEDSLMKDDLMKENLAYWSWRAPGYSQVNREELAGGHHDRWQKLLTEEIETRLKKPRNEIRILDIGTGPGFFAILLAEAGYQVTAADLTSEMLEEAKHNAGVLSKRICFIQMNAEKLEFEDESFDVVISRNLTWNLPNPEKAYAEWCRVLKREHGLLLNFDANWYGYLFDANAKEAYEADRKNSADAGFEDQNVGENFDIMEEIARRIPLSSVHRPAWDLRVLKKLGMQPYEDHMVWKRVWSRTEKMNFASTPLFMIRAYRPES